MVGVNVFAADTDQEARRLMTSVQQQWINLRRGTPGLLQPPVASMDGRWSPEEETAVHHALSISAVGSPETVRRALSMIVDVTRADELIMTGHIYDHRTRLRSFEIAAGVRDTLSALVR
jgi:alkanesulfonate monooxygenase SsuD/methylene tetrahydromethanopterin reductase-like flavin-dependent oxidoreductase (luciferase family)